MITARGNAFNMDHKPFSPDLGNQTSPSCVFSVALMRQLHFSMQKDSPVGMTDEGCLHHLFILASAVDCTRSFLGHATHPDVYWAVVLMMNYELAVMEDLEE